MKHDRQADAHQQETLDRRIDDRRPPDVQPTYVWVSIDQRFQAEVVDESDGGIGVILPVSDPFVIGFQVRVEFAGGRRTARIVYLEELDEGCRMGLAWE